VLRACVCVCSATVAGRYARIILNFTRESIFFPYLRATKGSFEHDHTHIYTHTRTHTHIYICMRQGLMSAVVTGYRWRRARYYMGYYTHTHTEDVYYTRVYACGHVCVCGYNVLGVYVLYIYVCVCVCVRVSCAL
jgi:hypothetical protein